MSQIKLKSIGELIRSAAEGNADAQKNLNTLTF